MDFYKAGLEAARKYLRQVAIDREMRKNAPKGTGPRPWTPKNISKQGVGSPRSKKVYEYKGMLVSQAKKLVEGDGVSVMIAGQRKVGILTDDPKIVGKTVILKVSYKTLHHRKESLALAQFTGYAAPAARMSLVLAPVGRVDF